jgi:hypothetical protein
MGDLREAMTERAQELRDRRRYHEGQVAILDELIRLQDLADDAVIEADMAASGIGPA